MTNDEKILEILTHMQSDITDLKTGQMKLEQDVTDLRSDVAGLKSNVIELKVGQAKLEHDVAGLKSDVAVLKSDVSDLKIGQKQLSQNIVNLENELAPKVTALFDGYTLRGEQIDNLKQHFDDRIEDFHEDVSYLISKTAKQEKQIFSITQQVKQLLPQ